ncbi:MAG: hypothetical protein MZV64_30455 [Ignavibacteriales bacterium]|nr:hypothetical protein [Ignavibacteriales bacterium]
MTEKLSFTSVERELAHEFRGRINASEDIVDLGNHFSGTMHRLVSHAIGSSHHLDPDAIVFDPDAAHSYSIRKSLRDDPTFQSLEKNSDLMRIISRFAEMTLHRYIHLKKHNERTDKKIRMS